MKPSQPSILVKIDLLRSDRSPPPPSKSMRRSSKIPAFSSPTTSPAPPCRGIPLPVGVGIYRRSEMDREEVFSNLPPEIILDILSRISIKTFFTCKCVCKSWLGLLETPEFARSHLSKSVPVLLIYRFTGTNVFKIVEFEDSLEIEHQELQTVLELDINENFNLRHGTSMSIEGSANGLLLLRDTAPPSTLYVCNPITREYMKLPKPVGIPNNDRMVTCGFGASRLSNQYKVVRIFHDCIRDPITGSLLSISNSVLQVYTLGTGSWKYIMAPSEMLLDYVYGSNGKLLNGNLHWLARDLTGTRWISCFNLETEGLTKFRAPTIESKRYLMDIGVLRDRLCLCDNSSENEISIYMVNDYGDERKSWNKEYTISKIRHAGQPYNVRLCAVKASGNGDILMTSCEFCMFCCSNTTKTVSLVHMFDEDVTAKVEAVMYTPSFISLKDFETEDAEVFEFVCSVI